MRNCVAKFSMNLRFRVVAVVGSFIVNNKCFVVGCVDIRSHAHCTIRAHNVNSCSFAYTHFAFAPISKEKKCSAFNDTLIKTFDLAQCMNRLRDDKEYYLWCAVRNTTNTAWSGAEKRDTRTTAAPKSIPPANRKIPSGNLFSFFGHHCSYVYFRLEYIIEMPSCFTVPIEKLLKKQFASLTVGIVVRQFDCT